MRRIGFVVNPVAGMGGRVGLKGTDDLVDEAKQLGAEPRAPDRAREALAALHTRAPDFALVTWGGLMGEAAAIDAGFDPAVLGHPADAEAADSARVSSETGASTGTDAPADGTAPIGETTAEDTRAAVHAFLDAGVDLVLFVGGDGTAVDVADVVTERDADTPILGVPAGVKVYSSVFAVTPRAAGRVAADFDSTEPREVNDLDEDAYREGDVETELRGVVNVPVAEDLQSSKQTLGGDVQSLAAGFVDDVEAGVTYVLGPGGTIGAIENALGVDGSPLGVDVYRDGELVVRDGTASEVEAALGDRNVVVVSPIGGQGFIFGRGNHQITPAVVRRSDLQVVASRNKLDSTGVLRVDTGDPELDADLAGWVRVRTGRFEEQLIQIV